MQHLRQIWAQAAASATPHLVTVLAPPGVGKTRLSVEFSGCGEGCRRRVVRGRSLPYRESSAYGAFATQVKQLAGIFESDSREVGRAKLGRTVDVPGRGRRRCGRPPSRHPARTRAGADGGRPRDAVLLGALLHRGGGGGSARRCSCSRTCTGPTRACSISSSCWAPGCAACPIVLLVLARPELLDARPGWGGGLPAYTALSLQPLAADESRKLADELLGGSGQRRPRLSRSRLGDRGGEPALHRAAGRRRAGAGRARAPNETLPTTIRGIVTARLDALPREERSVLLNAAVVGKVFWRGALARSRTMPASWATSSARSSGATSSAATASRRSRASGSTRSRTC